MRMSRAFTIAALCLFLTACSDNEDVYTGLSLRDANEMVALLRNKGVDASRVQESAAGAITYKITVPKINFAEAITTLSQNGYPRETFKTMAEVFPGEGLVVSPLEQRARYGFAVSQELSRTISNIDGIVKARVHVVLPDPDARTGQPSKASASVSIMHRAGVDPGDLGPKIRLIVSNAVQGLSYNDVSISFFVFAGGQDIAPQPQMVPSTLAPTMPNAMPAATSPNTKPGEVVPRRMLDSPEGKSETPAEIESSNWSLSSLLQYLAAFLAVFGGVMYIRRAMRNNS